ncbi:MAG: hypothetical protein KAW00_02865 [Dehalococcoidia bacterium]|nr:hypothetical protein [Dehalococcoidia bacterium]
MSDGESWEFFKTIENNVKRLKAIEATAQENRTILLVLFWLAFTARFEHTPEIARAAKDKSLLALKDLGLSQSMLDALEAIMLKQCDTFEARGKP